jgi:hypothetical protein
MGVEQKINVEQWVSELIAAHNEMVKSREFGPFVMKWFAVPDCKFSFTHEADGLDRAMLMWRHLLPAGTGEQAPRHVEQQPYKVEDGRVYTLRQVKGGGQSRPGDPTAGGGPRTLWGWQETQFDEHQLITELKIASATEEPDIEIDPEIAKTRQARIFSEFGDVFNEYFRTGNADLLAPWCSENIHMSINDTFFGMACAAPLNRMPPTLRFELQEFEEAPNGRVKVKLNLYNWGGLDMPGFWDMDVTEDGKLRELLVTVDV